MVFSLQEQSCTATCLNASNSVRDGNLKSGIHSRQP
ncbi:hypothetical protein EVA_19087 [gut metagenome]|uniref:Uncharacterized protein n=1 Tax=gut metagenome TaxID=749906 RepID=J9FTB0_9ZZZZ